ncbi:MAG: ATP-binding protein, partial [Proteobacteria bacterium]|nr:ATP-binding protein [Pseudomonadota bacterium]
RPRQNYRRCQKRAPNVRFLPLGTGFILWDAADEFVYCNGYFREIHAEHAHLLIPGYKLEDYIREISPSFVETTVSDVDDEGGEALSFLARVKSGRDSGEDFDYCLGNGRWFRVRRQRLEDGSLIALHTDITDRKRVEALKDEFLALASHELRTPLTSIMGAVGLVKSGSFGAIDPEVEGILGIAYRNCERLSHLVTNILDLSKIEAGEMDIEMEPVDVMGLVAEAIELNTVFAEALGRAIMVSNTLPGTIVLGDSKRLGQVLTNLLSNAAKFSKKDGRIEISVTRIDDRIRIGVRDYGIGIPPHFRENIFERFSQVEQVDNTGEPGTGLGLSIAKDIVELHGGVINYESQLGVGTNFYFELPEYSD